MLVNFFVLHLLGILRTGWRRSSEYSKQTVSSTQVIIRSLKDSSAPPRQCHRTTVEDNFKCYSCKSSIVREEQCVHLIVANKKKYLPDQFTTYHFQRKYVSGSHISLDPTEPHDEEEDMPDDDDSEDDINTLLLTDHGLSNERKDATHYEQLPSTKKNKIII